MTTTGMCSSTKSDRAVLQFPRRITFRVDVAELLKLQRPPPGPADRAGRGRDRARRGRLARSGASSLAPGPPCGSGRPAISRGASISRVATSRASSGSVDPAALGGGGGDGQGGEGGDLGGEGLGRGDADLGPGVGRPQDVGLAGHGRLVRVDHRRGLQPLAPCTSASAASVSAVSPGLADGQGQRCRAIDGRRRGSGTPRRSRRRPAGRASFSNRYLAVSPAR